MKYCKHELKIIPKRLSVFGNDGIPDNIPKSYEYYAENRTNVVDKNISQISANEIHKASPVDHSIGRIKSMAIGYTYYYNRNKINAFNKIYADLIIKISRLKKETGDKSMFDIYSMAFNGVDGTESRLEKANEAIRTLANFTDGYLGEQKRVSFDAIETKKTASQIWIQDNIISAKNENGVFLFGSKIRKSDNYNNNSPSKVLSELLECNHSVAFDTQMAGGNILFVGEYILVGYNSLKKDPAPGKSRGTYYTEKAFIAKIEQHFGKRKVLIIGDKKNTEINTTYQEYRKKSREIKSKENVSWLRSKANYQPIFHLDLFITPAGMTPSGKYRIVIGDPVFKLDRDDIILLEKGGLFDQTKAYINKIANELSLISDFEVTRIPMPLTWVDLLSSNGNLERMWMLASFNNCIIQYVGVDSDENYVLLPKYSGSYKMEKSEFKVKFKKIDTEGKTKETFRYVPCGDWSELKFYEEQAKLHWNDLGFRAVFLTNYLPMMTKKGAARCMTKVIERYSDEKLENNISKLTNSELNIIA